MASNPPMSFEELYPEFFEDPDYKPETITPEASIAHPNPPHPAWTYTEARSATVQSLKMTHNLSNLVWEYVHMKQSYVHLNGYFRRIIECIGVYDEKRKIWDMNRIRNMPSKRLDFAYASVGEDIFVAGGADAHPNRMSTKLTKTAMMYRPIDHKWTDLPDMHFGRHGCMGLGDNERGRFFVLGGTYVDDDAPSGKDQCEYIDPREGVWRKMAQFSYPLSFCACGVIDDDIIVAAEEQSGFFGPAPQNTCDTWALSLRMNQWRECANMPTPRMASGSCVWNGYLVNAGGRVSYGFSGKGTSSVELYEPKEDKWYQMPNLNSTRDGCTAVSLDGELYVAGGSDQEADVVHKSIERYDKMEKAWKEAEFEIPFACQASALVVRSAEIWNKDVKRAMVDAKAAEEMDVAVPEEVEVPKARPQMVDFAQVVG